MTCSVEPCDRGQGHPGEHASGPLDWRRRYWSSSHSDGCSTGHQENCRACNPPTHETYTYKSGRTWAWNCLCGSSGGEFARRMDADSAAEQHEL